MSKATVSDVFDVTMQLIDEVSDTGLTQTTDTEEYRNRTIGIMNILISECYPFSDEKDNTKLDSAWRAVQEFDDSLKGIDNTLALGVMPYGLAANLLTDENPTAANYYQQRYEALLAAKRSRMQADVGEIENVYGGIEYGYFSRW